MIKRTLLLFLLLATLIAFGQQIDVITSSILTLGNMSFAAPQFSPDGRQLLLTQVGFRGLWVYDLENKSLFQVNDLAGAGYEPIFTEDGKEVIFRVDEYVNKRKYSAIMIQTIGDITPRYLTEKVRHLSLAILLNNDQLIYRENRTEKNISLSAAKSDLSNIADETYGYINYGKITIRNTGKTIELIPFENKDYIWFSLSPDKSQFIFTVVGGSTYISNIYGNILTEIGKANAPKWSPDGKWILYMVDEDDGHVITSSEIWAYHVDSKTRVQLTKTNDIHEMYPSWSPKMDKITCETDNGKIIILDIRRDG